MLFNLKVLAYLDVLLLIGLLGFRQALLPSSRSLVGPKVIALVLATPVVALVGGNNYVFHAYLICAVAFTSRTRMELCCTYLLMLPLMPSLQLDLRPGGLYLLGLKSFTSMNIGALIGLMITRGRVQRTDGLLDLLVLLLVLVLSSIGIRGVTATAILRLLVENALMVVPPYLLVSRTAVDMDDVRRLMTYLCLAAFLGSVVAIFGMVRRWDLYEPFFAALNVDQTFGSTALAVRGGRMRMGGPFTDYSAFGLFLAVVIVSLPVLRRPFSRGGFVVIAAGLLVGLFTTQSRGAWVGLLIGFAVFQGLRGRRSVAAAMIGGGALAYMVLGAILAPTSRLAETLGTSGASAQTGDYRWQLLRQGLEQVAAHPFTGQPPEDLEKNMAALVQGQHMVDFVNTHLYIAMVTGLSGFMIWAFIWLSTACRVMMRSGQGSEQARRTGLTMLPVAIIVTACISLTFTSMIDRNLYWLLIAVAFATPVLVRRNVVRDRRGPFDAATLPLMSRDAPSY